MTELDIYIEGTPQAQGSKIRTKHGIRESNENLRPWRDTLCYYFRQLWQDKPTLETTVACSMVFTFKRPKYHLNRNGVRPGAPLFKGTKPDIDKLTRAVLDALTEAQVIRDDSLVASLVVTKLYGETPGVLVRVSKEGGVYGNGAFGDKEKPIPI